jgi:hypothetical protein
MKTKKLYKILEKTRNTYRSPFREFPYGKKEDFIGKLMVCKDFDVSNEECSSGFYATEIDGLIYTNLSDPSRVVFEVEMSGKNIRFDEYKWRWEKQKFIREVPMEEVKELVKQQSEKMDWDYYSALFPYNPLCKKTKVTKKHIELLKQWSSIECAVWYYVTCSIEDSIGYLVKNCVKDSVWDYLGTFANNSFIASVKPSLIASVIYSMRASAVHSIKSSVRDSVGAYMSSLFPNIKKWEGIEHEEGVNPFQSGIDLWNSNLVPSFDGTTWRLHSGKKAEVVFEITKKELEKIK